jgi:hypothetical protein
LKHIQKNNWKSAVALFQSAITEVIYMELSNFIKSMKLDEQNRILISVHEFLEGQLSTPENRKMIKDGALQILGDNFKQLEIGKNVCRVTVVEGTEEESIAKIETGIKSALEMAMSFMSNPPGSAPTN